jgi:DNA-binding response OmpR family regulator
MTQLLGRILLIDDDPELVDVLAEYFAGAGYEVMAAHRGADGLTLADQKRPDVVLLDIRMPGMSGVQVLQQLRLRSPELPVVMISGAGDLQLARGCLTRGAFDYVAKPFVLDHVHRCVAAALTHGSRPAASGR